MRPRNLEDRRRWRMWPRRPRELKTQVPPVSVKPVPPPDHLEPGEPTLDMRELDTRQ